MRSRKTIVLAILFLWTGSYAQEFEHPRGLVKSAEVQSLREKVKFSPYKEMLEGYINQYKTVYEEGKWKLENEGWEYPVADLALISAQIYLLTGEKEWALKSQEAVNQTLNDTVKFQNREAFGLTRAQSLLKVMMAYDYCYDAWDETYRKWFSEKVYPVIYSLSASMGNAANYDMASNWMGVRYGTVLYSSLVWDDYLSDTQDSKNRVAALRFNAIKRIEDFALANIHPDGWNVESLGYWLYGWNFIYPALIAWENHYGLSVENLSFYERMVKAAKAGITAFVPIRNINSIGIKADFSDDGTAMNTKWLPYAYRLIKDPIRANFRYAMEEVNQLKDWGSGKGGAFENILFTKPEDKKVPLPKEWRNFYSPGQGVLVSRNLFKDANDIVVAFSATSHRRGHQGGDNLSFRVAGLNNLWVVGAGRTNLVAGQSSFFPEKPNASNTRYEKGKLGKVDTVYYQEGKSFISAVGSCTGVINHQRQIQTEFDSNSAKIVITDTSENGKVWRLNTPEFNKVKLSKNGFEIEGPNGAKMKGKVLSPFQSIEQGTNRYGGNTERHNYGIFYQGKQYMNTNYIDILCDKNITIELVLVNDEDSSE